jgi:short-subunit dehydrogenase
VIEPKQILIFGAASAIAHETAKLFARDGASLYLCARNEENLRHLASDLAVRGAKEVAYSTFDALDVGTIVSAVDKCLVKFPELDALLVAHGELPDQKKCESDLEAARKAIDVNFTSAALISTSIAKHFEQKGRGVIAVISSVAGDRGRQSNYVYGSAKGALSIFLSGLRQRLHKAGVTVITIKPGFVDTPMTANFKKGFLFVSPQAVARGIHKAIRKGGRVVYLPWFWQGIMMIIRSIPETIFKKMNL